MTEMRIGRETLRNGPKRLRNPRETMHKRGKGPDFQIEGFVQSDWTA